MTYKAPLAEQTFVLEIIAQLPELARFPEFSALEGGLEQSILAEGGRLAAEVFAPLNRKGDVEGAVWSPQGVKHPVGFAEAFAAYVEGGWGALAADPKYGGQGLPYCISTACGEQLTSANMAFSLCMLLSAGAVEAISAHGSEEQKALYLPKLISGEWTGTMNLTEPHAGSDVGSLRTAAHPAGDGSWRIKGSKIFITWGEHELARNIVHLVLARTPEAPAGTKGISLFLVPKFLPDEQGGIGGNDGTARRNDLRCVSIEHKLGIHASPTCTMSYGDHDECVGWLIGAEHAGMKAMFTMMNSARVNVGVEGVAIAERAYQGALAYARERVQFGKIIQHPDVRRMLLTMRAITQAIRAIAYCNAAAIDRSRVERDPGRRAAARRLADLLTPITKAYATDMGVQMASLGIQVFGGMGFVEETGAAQHLRDIRIAPIYEGTNGIQALDLVGRKLHADGGEAWRSLLREMTEFSGAMPVDADLGAIRTALSQGLETLSQATQMVFEFDPVTAASTATPYLKLFGIVLGAYLMAKQSCAAAERLANGVGESDFLKAKIATTRFFTDNVLPEAGALHETILRSSRAGLFVLTEEQLAL